MLQSGVFRGAARSSTVLRYLVEQTLAGHSNHLKDYSIGAEALGRGPSFDPRTDPIARVEASRLRSKLELYYATEGANDPLVIGLPKGGYVPVFELRRETSGAEKPLPDPRPPASIKPRGLVAAAVAAGLVVAGIGAWRLTPVAVPQPERRLEITTPATTDPLSLALSPDGSNIVFVASDGGHARLWLRPLDSTTARPLPGTEHASLPFWSPDNRSIGFFAGATLKRIDVETGLVRPIGGAIVPAGGTWNRDGTILHPLVPDSPVARTTSNGGRPELLLMLDMPRETGHRAPHFLPDGRHFLYYAMGTSDTRGIYSSDLSGGPPRRIVDADTPAVFGSNHLFYLVGGTLFAQPFDPEHQKVTGAREPVASHVAFGGPAGVAALSASVAGPIAYRSGSAGGQRQFVWVDRAGRELSRVGTPGSFGSSGYATMSPDRRRLAVQRAVDGDVDIWLLDLERDAPIRFTTVPQADIAPIWSPRGDRIVYSSLRDGRPFNLYEQPVSGGPGTLLLATNEAKQVTDWTRDGRFLLFRTVLTNGDTDIWGLDLAGDRTPFEVVRTGFAERDGAFSPDGTWIAYQANESGRFEIYLQPFRRTGPRRRVSIDGGTQAQWRADGRELFFLALDGRLMSVPVSWADGSPVPGDPAALFTARVGGVEDFGLHLYLPSADGQRFLLDTMVEEQVPPIVVILNWKPRSGAARP